MNHCPEQQEQSESTGSLSLEKISPDVSDHGAHTLQLYFKIEKSFTAQPQNTCREFVVA